MPKDVSTNGENHPSNPEVGLPALPEHKTRGLPSALLEDLRALMGACQKFGWSSGRSAPIGECQARMQIQQDKTVLFLDSLKQQLDARYASGVEMGREWES